MQEPAAYSALHAVPGRVTCIETHVSWVFLTGPFAYKVKKPVDFGFVDFSSLERRRRFCEEELRLNRRLAPQLYLGAHPLGALVGQPARLQLVALGAIAFTAQKLLGIVGGRQDELHPFQRNQSTTQFGVSEQRERRGDAAQLVAGLEVRAHQVNDAVCAAVGNQFHVFLSGGGPGVGTGIYQVQHSVSRYTTTPSGPPVPSKAPTAKPKNNQPK